MSALAGPSQRRPVAGEVIVDFSDGSGTYIKSRLEDNVLAVERRKIERDEARKAKRASEALEKVQANGSEEKGDEGDVALIVGAEPRPVWDLADAESVEQKSEMDVDEQTARDALRRAGGDVVKALSEMVAPDPERIGWRARR